MTERRIIVDPLEDDGDLVEELYENQPDRYRPIKREDIRVILETLVRLEYEITWIDDHERLTE
jgi:hypothetical protein